jgi:LacI family transcriptional regulator
LLSEAAGARPDAIFALCDVLAIGVLHGAHELGLNIPGDVSVIGYDDIELAGYTFPPLTTVRQPAAEIGAAAANAVIDHLDNDVALPNAVALKPELIVRASVG